MNILNRLSGQCVMSRKVGGAKEGLERTCAKLEAIFGVLFFAFIALMVISPATTYAAFPGTNGKIAFISNRDGDYEIYVMNADGSNQTRLTNVPGEDAHPEWSPDGSKIAFNSMRDGNYEIYVMNADGTGQTNLTNDGPGELQPTWSPDGSKIAYQRYLGERYYEIFVMNADGTNPTQLTHDPGHQNLSAAWSPDGTKIAFMSDRDGDYDIYVMNADGTGVTQLTNATGQDGDPDWSPDGSKILFTSQRTGAAEIYVMNADGTGVTQLTNNNPALAGPPSWSPDGTRIAFQTNTGSQVYVMNADGTGITQLTSTGSVNALPDWQRLPVVINVMIDIKPGSAPNSLNPKSKGNIPVALLSTDTFAAGAADVRTIRFGATGTEASSFRNVLEDVDGDGDIDMVLNFRIQDTGIVCGVTSASLTGKILRMCGTPPGSLTGGIGNGQTFKGTDSVKPSGCKKK